MNPAIEKLDERIEAATAYPQTVKDLTALKACVEALEELTKRKRILEGEEFYACCSGSPAYGHFNCKPLAALTLVNRAMGVSHE